MKENTILSTQITNEVVIVNYFKPGINLSEDKYQSLVQDLNLINGENMTPVDYGILAKNLDKELLKEKLKNSFISITYINSIPVCASHGFIHEHTKLGKPIFYFGLVQNNAQLKMDLTGTMLQLMLKLLSMHYKEGIAATITIHAKIAEAIDMMTEETYPSPYYKKKRPPTGYQEYANEVINFYAKPCWSHLGEIELNNNTFILSIENKSQSGFVKESYNDMIRAEDWLYDLFMQHKINWEKQNDLLFIGKVTAQIFENANNIFDKKFNSSAKEAA